MGRLCARNLPTWQPDAVHDGGSFVAVASAEACGPRGAAALLRSGDRDRFDAGPDVRLQLRETEGLLASILGLMVSDLAVAEAPARVSKVMQPAAYLSGGRRDR